jgi:hypothetical protein
MSLRAEQLLERAVAQARQLTVSPERAEARARETVRWGRAVQAAQRRAPWRPVLAVAAVAAAAAIALWWRPGPERPEPMAITDVGERVALAPGPGALFSVVESSPSSTVIRVAAGQVTARLYRGAAGHRLSVAAGGVRFEATGTIYTVVMPDTGAPYAIVHEGTIDVVTERGEERSIPAGAAWPARQRVDRTRPAQAAERLRQHRRATAEGAGALDPGRAAQSGGASESRPAAEDTASPVTADAAPPETDREATPAGPDARPADAAEDVWRHARLLRGQGRYRDALRELARLAAGGDPVWAPIAHLERMRILATMSDPRAVRDLGAQFRSRWPGHDLVGEATTLYCMASRQMGDAAPAGCEAHASPPGRP